MESYFGENGEEAIWVSVSIYLRVIGSCYLRVLSQASQRIIYPFLLFLNPWLLVWKVFRNFLWESSEGSFKYPLVAWEKVCLPVEMGGLGLRSVVSFNQALLGKWLWRYGHEVSHLWRRLISTKYGEG